MTHLDVALLHLHRFVAGRRPFSGEYAIFGSTALRLRGIIERDPQDIDVFVSRGLWGYLLGCPGWRVETPNAGDPPILSYRMGIDLNLFFDWRDDQVEIDVRRLMAQAETVSYDGDDFKVARVEEVLAHKQAALAYGSPAVQKHRPDIEAIERWLSVTA